MHVGYAGAVEKSALFDWSKDKDSQLSKYKKNPLILQPLFVFCFLQGGGLGSRICVGLHFKLIYKQ